MSQEGTGIPSSRGLIDFDIGPLRKFTGILDSMPREDKVFGEGASARPYKQITVNVKDIDILEATEPYHFPIFVFQMNESNRKKSRYGVFSESFNAVVDSQYTPEQLDPSNPEFIKAADRMDFEDVIGKNRIGFVLADGEDGRPEMPGLFDGRATDAEHPKGQDMPTPAWTIYEVEGVGIAGTQGISAVDMAKALLDGKTLTAFNKEAIVNPAIRADVGLIQSIGLPVSAAGNFANALVTAGEFTKDAQGVYHRVEAAT